MKYPLIFALSLLLVCTVSAQMKISGHVTFQEEGVPGATVQVLGKDHGAVTDASGHYEIKGLSGGEITLIVRSIGYQQVKKTIKTEVSQTVDFLLSQNELGLDEVVITGTMQPTMVTASPIKVEVITNQHLNTYLPSAASSIMDGITLINGVQEVVACGVCFTNSISINGLPGPYTAVLIDGSPMFGNLASVYGLNGIPNMMIDRFEVIKGPNSTLYGSEAMAGVINVITKDPENQPKFSIDVMGTTHLETFGNIGFTSRTKRFKGFTGLNYAIISDFDDVNDDGFGDRINLDRYSLFSKWEMDRPNDKQWTIAGKLYYEDRRNGVEAFMDDRAYRQLRGNDSIYGESIYTYRGEVFGTYEFQSKHNIKVDYSFSQHYQDSYYGADHYQAEQTIGFTNLIWTQSAGSHQLLAGLTNRLQYYDDNTAATALQSGQNEPQNQWIPGIFFQDELEWTDRITLLGGLRIDHYSAHGLIFSPRLSSKFKAGQWTTLRVNFGTGFRVVNLFTEDHAFVTGQRKVVIEEAMNPEESFNASFNFNHVFTLGSSQGMFDLDAYYTWFQNKIIPDYDDPGFIRYANSSGYAVSRGVGLNWNQEFTFPLSYTLGANVQSVQEFEPNDQGETLARDVEFAPMWSGVFNANYQWKQQKLTMAYSANLTGPMALPEVYDLDENGQPRSISRPEASSPFAFHNLQVTKVFTEQFSIYLGIQNIFNYMQEESPLVGYNDPGSPTGFSQYFDTSYAYAPIHGREFYLGVKWSLP